MRKTIQSLLAALTLVAAQGMYASAAAPVSTPSLTGEILVSAQTTTPNRAHCNLDGTGYITFSASGDAIGPYAGTFRERGVVFTTLQNGLYYEHFFAQFAIKSVNPKATINGTKAEIPAETFPPPPATCQSYVEGTIAGYQNFNNFAQNLYEATIKSDGRTYRDRGTSRTQIIFTCVAPDCPPDIAGFFEDFTSSNGAVLYPSKDDSDHSNGSYLRGLPKGVDLSVSN